METVDYIVSPEGRQTNAGSEQRSFRRLSTAVERADPGETVFISGGLYERSSSVTISDVRGEEDDFITLVGDPADPPVFEFDGPNPGGWGTDGGITFRGVENLDVRNIVVRNSPSLGIRVTDGSIYNTFENIAAHRNNLVGFGVYDGSNGNTIANVVSNNNYDVQNGGSDADGVQVFESDRNLLQNVRTYNNSDDGIDLFRSRDSVVRDCQSWNNGRGEYGDGNGFKLGGGERPSGDHLVVRNVAYNNRSFGFNDNGAEIDLKVYNNTAWNNAPNFSFFESDHELKNNISYEGDVALGEWVVEEANTWNLDIEEPEFVSLDPERELFLHLAEDSPCIDSGVPVQADLEFSGSVPDLGAYEYDREE